MLAEKGIRVRNTLRLSFLNVAAVTPVWLDPPVNYDYSESIWEAAKLYFIAKCLHSNIGSCLKDHSI